MSNDGLNAAPGAASPYRTLRWMAALTSWCGILILREGLALAERILHTAFPEQGAWSYPSPTGQQCSTSPTPPFDHSPPAPVPTQAHFMGERVSSQGEHTEAEASQVWFAVHRDSIASLMVWASGCLDGMPADQEEIELALVNFELECRLRGESEDDHPSVVDMNEPEEAEDGS